MNAGEELLDQMQKERGFVVPLFATLMKHDPEFCAAMNEFSRAGYLKNRHLDRKTKELIFIAIAAVLRIDLEHVMIHIEAALREGATPQEALEVLELTAVPSGLATLRFGVTAWTEVMRKREQGP